MTRDVIRKYVIPRWLYTAVKVPKGSELRVDPDAFSNPTKYRMKLVALSMGSPNPTTYSSHNQTNEHPPWTHELLMDIDKSGCGALNLVSATPTAICGNLRRIRPIIGDANMGRSWRLITPYLLPRDEGLRVSVEWIKPQYISGEERLCGPDASGEVTFIAKGYKPDGYPAMLAGRVDGFTGRETNGFIRGNAQLMNSVDLFNNGKTEIYITEFLFKETDFYVHWTAGEGGDVPFYFPSGNAFNFAWQVNPTNPTFTQFMPQPRHIPTGLITPMVRTVDGGAESPLVYFFPPETWLDPKQALGVRLGNTSTESDTELHLCMIGELEVR